MLPFLLESGEIVRDFLEILSFFGYDLIRAQVYIDDKYRFPDSVIDEVLEDAGLEKWRGNTLTQTH